MIKKIIFVFVILMGWKSHIHAQTFNKLFTGNFNDVYNAVQPTTDGGYMVVGTTNTFGPTFGTDINGMPLRQNDILLCKYTSAGVMSWARTYGTTDNNEEGVHLEIVGNNFIVGAHFRGPDVNNANDNKYQRILLFEVNQSGGLIPNSMQMYGGATGMYSLKSIQVENAGGFLICGDYFEASGTNPPGFNNSAGHFFYMELAANKSITRQGFYGLAGHGDIARKAIRSTKRDINNNLIDNIFIIGGTHENVNGTTDDYNQTWLRLTPVNGSNARTIDRSIWTGPVSTAGNLNDDFTDIIETAQNDLVIVGYIRPTGTNAQITLTKIAPDGTPIWNNTISTPGNDFPKQILLRADGGFDILCISTGTGAGSNDGIILRTNSLGALLTQSPIFSFGYGGNDQLSKFIRNSDNGFTMVGLSNSASGGGTTSNNNAHIVRCDDVGSTFFNCSFGTFTSGTNSNTFTTNKNFVAVVTTIATQTLPTLIDTELSDVSVNNFPSCACPTISIGTPITICPEVPTITFAGSPAAGTFSGNNYITSAGVFNMQSAVSGTYTITYTLTNPSPSCTASESINFTIPSDYQVLFNPPTTICPGTTSVTLEATPTGGTFSGNSYITGSVFDVTQAGPGNHTLKYTYTKPGCSPTVKTVQTTVVAPITLNFPLDPIICPDIESVELQATPSGGTYSGPYVTGNVFNVNAAPTGTYDITYTYAYPAVTCGSVVITKTVEVTRYKVIVDIPPLLCADVKMVDIYMSPAGGVLSGDFIVGNKFDAESAGPGTHTVTYTYAYATCPPQTAIDRTVVLPGTKFLDRILSTSALTLSDNWPVNFSHASNLTPTQLVSLKDRDDYYKGVRGIWKADANYVYVANREQDPNIKLQTDGIFNNFPLFQWNSAAMDVCYPGWRKLNTITQYDPFSNETENRDILGLYSSALLSSTGGLTVAVAANASENEMAFNGFEEYSSSNELTPSKVANSNLSIYNAAPTSTTLANQYFRKYEVLSATDNKLTVVIPFARATELIGKSVTVHGSIVDNYTNKNIAGLHNISSIDPDSDPNKTTIWLNPTTFTTMGVWKGSISYTKNYVSGALPFFQIGMAPVVTTEFAHTGSKSLRITSGMARIEQIRLDLKPGKKYVVSAWIRSASEKPTYAITVGGEKRGVGLDFLNSGGQLPAVLNIIEPTGPVIDGWQRLEGEVTVPANAGPPVLILSTATNIEPTYFDDIRIFPIDGGMKSFVYNPVNFKPAAVLDDNNYATFYEYDESGALYQIKIETEKGIQTVKESFTHAKEKPIE